MVIVIIYSGVQRSNGNCYYIFRYGGDGCSIYRYYMDFKMVWFKFVIFSVSLLRCGSTSNQEGVCVRVFITQLHGCYVDN